MKNNRLFYLDFIRTISVIFIVLFHFNISMQTHNIVGNKILFINYANINLGNIGVSLFFIISGIALMYKYNEIFSIKSYFKKRFMAIFPMFWISYIIAFLYLFYIYKTINHSIPKWNFMLTILGMDGYLFYAVPNFYILGEWFLGCIIILYCCFPILRKLIIKNPKLLFIFTCIFYLIFVKIYGFNMMIDHNFLIRIFDFIIGMYFILYIKEVKIYQFFLSLIIIAIILFIPIYINQMYKITISGISLFLVLVYISKYFNCLIIQNVTDFISKYSYAIFLSHHIIIEQVLIRFNGSTITKTETICLFVITTIIIIVISVYIYKISNIITSYVLNYNKYK